MKYLKHLSSLLFISNLAFATPLEYDRAVTVGNPEKAFSTAELYLAQVFINSNNSVRVRNQEEGLLVAHGSFTCTSKKFYWWQERVELNIVITLEDEIAKIKIQDIDSSSYNYNPFSGVALPWKNQLPAFTQEPPILKGFASKGYPYIKECIEDRAKDLLNRFTVAMQ